MIRPDGVTVVDLGGGNMDIYLDGGPAITAAPEPPVIAALRLQQEREDWALQIARQRLGVTPEAEFKSPETHSAVMAEKAKVLEEYE